MQQQAKKKPLRPKQEQAVRPGREQAMKSIGDMTPEQLQRTCRTNIFSYCFMTQAGLPHLKEGSAIITTTSVDGSYYSGQVLHPNGGEIVNG